MDKNAHGSVVEGVLPDEETPEKKRARLRSVLERSREVFLDRARPLREGALTVIQRTKSGEQRTVSGIVAIGIDDEAVEFGVIEADDEVGVSCFVDWKTIIDVSPS